MEFLYISLSSFPHIPAQTDPRRRLVFLTRPMHHLTHIWRIDINEWVATCQFDDDQISVGKSARNSRTDLSVSGQTQVLEYYPALLSYAAFELFTHARLAEEHVADPSHSIDRLKGKKTWARWITLREYVTGAVELIDYAAKQGLSTWVSNLSSNQTTAGRAAPLRPSLTKVVKDSAVDPDLGHTGSDKLYGGQVLWPTRTAEKYVPPGITLERDRAFLKRPSSVASFSSASSHTGSMSVALDNNTVGSTRITTTKVVGVSGATAAGKDCVTQPAQQKTFHCTIDDGSKQTIAPGFVDSRHVGIKSEDGPGPKRHLSLPSLAEFWRIPPEEIRRYVYPICQRPSMATLYFPRLSPSCNSANNPQV